MTDFWADRIALNPVIAIPKSDGTHGVGPQHMGSLDSMGINDIRQDPDPPAAEAVAVANVPKEITAPNNPPSTADKSWSADSKFTGLVS